MTESTTGRTIDPEGVEHPAHYNLHPSGVECIDLIRGLNFDVGSAVKYVMRRGLKDDPVKDLRKARFYLRDYRYDGTGAYNQPMHRSPKLSVGSIGDRTRWDRVAAAEPDPIARDFYLAIARFDIGGANTAVDQMIVEAAR